MGEKPSHPELLDWLATEFTRPADQLDADGRAGLGWSLKRLHKLILTSATYMQASRPTEPGWSADRRESAMASWKKSRELDPDNRLLARMNRLRLDGESIRDAMLASADRLSPRRGGPGVRPPLPDELVATLLKNQWTVAPDEEDHRRRSIYIFVRRNLRYPLFDVFDRPDTNASCPQRPRSTTALQGLALLNSEFSLDAARDLASFVWQDGGVGPEAQVDLCYRRLLGRDPTDRERTTGVEFLRRQANRFRTERRRGESPATPGRLSSDANIDACAFAALADYCLGLVNLNEFVYVD
jgi:hypothetical protein